MPNGAIFINNSIIVNGINMPGKTLVPPLGLCIGTVPVDDVITVTFQYIALTIPLMNPIENIGNTVAKNVILKDSLSNGVIFIEDSIEINGSIFLGGNLLSGIDIGNINENTRKTVSFKVKVLCL